MKKVTSREFQNGFGKVIGGLKPGQSVQITKHGHPVGQFTKQPKRTITCPNFPKDLEAMGADAKIGNLLLKKFAHDALL